MRQVCSNVKLLLRALTRNCVWNRQVWPREYVWEPKNVNQGKTKKKRRRIGQCFHQRTKKKKWQEKPKNMKNPKNKKNPKKNNSKNKGEKTKKTKKKKHLPHSLILLCQQAQQSNPPSHGMGPIKQSFLQNFLISMGPTKKFFPKNNP